MPQINCYLPIKLCITGRLSDTQLEQLSETLQRAISARISFANQEITAANGVDLLEGSAEVVREGFDPEHHDGATDSYQVPSYQRGGQPVGVSLRGSLRRRPWFIRKAIHFHSRIGKFLDLVEEVASDPSAMSGKVLYKDVFDELRWVSVWLVQVNRHYTLTQIAEILSERAMDLSRLRSDQFLVYGLATQERFRRKLIQIDEDGIVSREIPSIGTHNFRLWTNVAGVEGVDRGGWVLFAGMVLPRVEQGDVLALDPEVSFSLPVHALDFIVNDALFQDLTGVSWENYVNQFGDQIVSLRILPFTTLRPVHFDTIRYFLVPIVASSVYEDSVYLGNVHLLNQSRLERLPAAVRGRARQLTNEVTLPLDESHREGLWQAGWRGAFIYAVVSKTGEQPVQPEAERAGQQDPRETPAQLISRFTSWANLDEDGLGAYLFNLVRRAPALSHYVQRVLDELDDRNRDDVSLAFVEAATDDADLDNLARSPNGRLLLGRLYDELTSGELGASEQAQAQRLLAARVRARSIEVVARRVETARGWIFPYRQGGPTVLNSSPINAQLLSDGRIRVRLYNVSRSAMFQNEVQTLPDAVFSGGVTLEPDEWVQVKLYDEGGIIVRQPALYLLQISNQGVTKTLHSIATVVVTIGTLGAGGAAAGASWGVRALVYLDRAATALSIIGIIVNDHRGWIIETFGEAGRTFISTIEIANTVAGFYGIGRLAVATPRLVGNVRNAWRNWRSSPAYGSLRGSDLNRAEELSEQVQRFIHNADEAAAAAEREAASLPAVDPTPVEPIPSPAPQRPLQRPPEPPEPPGGGGPPGSPHTPTLHQRQRAAALRSDATALEREAASLANDAAVLEREATALSSIRPDRAERLRQRAARMRRVATRLEDEIAAARNEATEFERGTRSATSEFPDADELEWLFQSARSDTHVIRVPLAQIERKPGLILRLIRPLMRSRSGNRVCFRVEGGGSRELIDINQATGNVTLARGDTIHLNFGSPDRALEFLRANRGRGARIVAFEVDEQWVRALRSGAIPERGTKMIQGTQRSVDVTAAEDQLQIPANLIDELEQFIIPGSGRQVEVTGL